MVAKQPLLSPLVEMSHKGAQLVAPASLAAWRAWLSSNHAAAPGIWLVWHKQATGRAQFRKEEAVMEALCFGWIDSLPRAVDEARTSCYFSRRKPSSAWSAVNKRYVDELVGAGRMAAAGLAAVQLAKSSGAWAALDASDALIVPPDLVGAFELHASARAAWGAFPPSTRKALLQWIYSAKRPETRAERVRQTVEAAAAGKRANEYTRPVAVAAARHAEGAVASAMAVGVPAAGKKRSSQRGVEEGSAGASSAPPAAKKERR